MLRKLIVSMCVMFVAALSGYSPESIATSKISSVDLHKSDNEPEHDASSANNPFIIASPGVQIGTTAYDVQRWDDGVRVAVDKSGNVHFTYMYYPLSGGAYNSRAVMYNVWLPDKGEFAFKPSVKISGALRAGYPTIGVLSDGRAVIAYHESEIIGVDTSNYCCVTVDEAPILGAFSSKRLQYLAGKEPLWPDIKIGADDVIHIKAHQSVNDYQYDGEETYYCRSTDKGKTFSNWTTITNGTVNQGSITVSPDGKKIAVLYILGYKYPGNDTVYYNFGHYGYRESTDAGKTWGAATIITKDRFPDEAIIDEDFRLWGVYNGMNLTGSYDDKGLLHVIMAEGYISTPDLEHFSWIPRNAIRLVHWASGTKQFSAGVSGRMNVIPTNGGGNPWESPLDSFWGWGYITTPPTGGDADRPYIGCILPVLARWGSKLVCVWQGQTDTLDISAAGYVNMDIFVSVSGDYGNTWRPIEDFDSTDLGTYAAYFTNLTNTHTPDAGPGACSDEASVSIWPIVGTDNILHITYIEDKFAENFVYGDPTQTLNPVMYLKLQLVGIKENPEPQTASIELLEKGVFTGAVTFKINAALTSASLRIFDASGALVETVVSGKVDQGTITWNSSRFPSGVYFYNLKTPSSTSSGRIVVVH
ncbi:T9SS type A sorting domain-containing protein [bacterium]|nr:T9SS type A sorting domain-containing protein [bacterium]